MKNLILILVLLITLGSCKDKNQPLDPNAKLSLNGVATPSKAINTKGIGGSGITDSLEFIVKYAWRYHTPTIEQGSNFGYAENYTMFRDFEKKKLIFWGINVIHNGELGNFVTEFDDIVLVTGLDEKGNARNPKDGFVGCPIDTIGYIPNSVIREARAAITDAFNKGDYETCYKLFDNAYVFVPTTGAKWRKLKARGEN